MIRRCAFLSWEGTRGEVSRNGRYPGQSTSDTISIAVAGQMLLEETELSARKVLAKKPVIRISMTQETPFRPKVATCSAGPGGLGHLTKRISRSDRMCWCTQQIDWRRT